MVIVEGCDGTGKSTLVAKICEHFGLEEGARSTEDRDHLFETVKFDTFSALAIACASPATLVWDRFFYSELVYATVVRKERPKFNAEQAMYCQRMVNALHAPVILCCPPFEEVAANVEGTAQMPGVLENLRRIYDGYTDLMHTNGIGAECPLIRYDYTKPWAWYEIQYHVQRYLTWKESLWT